MRWQISKAVIEKEGKFLLLLRRDGNSYPNMWDFAGGKLDPGETPEQACIREVSEETHQKISELQALGEKEYSDDVRAITFYYFSPEKIEGDVVLSKDHDDFGWFTLEDIKIMPKHPSLLCYFNLE